MHGDPWVLLVEDNPNDRELTMMALGRGSFPHRIQPARDGVEALDVLLCRGAWADRDPKDHPDVVLLDVNMPRVDGLEVLRTIKSDQLLREVPVVMLTSSAEHRDLATSYSFGANSYVVKPMDIDEFLATVQRVGEYWLLLNRAGPESPV